MEPDPSSSNPSNLYTAFGSAWSTPRRHGSLDENDLDLHDVKVVSFRRPRGAAKETMTALHQHGLHLLNGNWRGWWSVGEYDGHAESFDWTFDVMFDCGDILARTIELRGLEGGISCGSYDKNDVEKVEEEEDKAEDGKEGLKGKADNGEELGEPFARWGLGWYPYGIMVMLCLGTLET